MGQTQLVPKARIDPALRLLEGGLKLLHLVRLSQLHHFSLVEVPAVAHDELGAVFIHAGSADVAVPDGPPPYPALGPEELVLLLHFANIINIHSSRLFWD